MRTPAGVLLRPALAAAARMRTGLRLALLVLVLMVPGIVATAAYTSEADTKIDFNRAELGGSDVVRQALIALTDTLAGRPADLGPLRAAVARHPEFALDKALSAVPEPAGGTPQARLATAEPLAALITEAANVSNLILDPDLDSFYVMDAQVVQIPKALIAAARAAATEAGATGSDAVAAQAVHAGELSAAASSLRTDVQVAQANTAMGDLAVRLAPLVQAADALDALAKQLTDTLATPGPVNPAAGADAVRNGVGPVAGVLDDLLEARLGAFERQRLVILAVTVGGFVLAAWFAAAVIWRTRHDVAMAVTGVTAIADGDFTERPLPAGRDELGDIGKALAAARRRLVAQEEELHAAQTVREEQLRVSFRHQRQAEVRLRDRAQAIIDESTGVIAEELRLVTSQVGDVREAADTIDHGIAATDQATEAVVGQARQAEQVITSLEESLRRVAATTELVKGIAGQTRLLALNATIEAARAGELGLGFTVVADEVKELATTTTQSTEQIAETIGKLERDTAEMAATISAMVAAIGSVGESALSLRAVAADQGTVVGRLADRVHETIGRVEEMSGLAAQLERRQADRIAASGRVELAVTGTRRTAAGSLLNVSTGGIRVQVGHGSGIEPGEIVQARLGEGGDHPIELPAQVVNSEPATDGDQLGLQFMAADEAMAERIDEWVGRLLDDTQA